MTLADEVLAERKRRSTNPEFVHLSDEILALCAVLQRREDIAVENGLARISILPDAFAGNLEPRITAKPRRRT